MKVEIRHQAFEPYAELLQYQQDISAGRYGACASFVGTMRDFNQQADVKKMTLEHYADMTQHQLEKIMREHIAQYALLDAMILHRVGDIYPNDPIVLVAAWSAHRAAAFDACRGMMEALKSYATFWKKETLDDASARWVDVS